MVQCSPFYQAVISHVYDPSKKASRHSHLVAQIKGATIYADGSKLITVHPAYHKLHGKNEADSQWYLFNDFLVTGCPVSEVVDFSFKVIIFHDFSPSRVHVYYTINELGLTRKLQI